MKVKTRYTTSPMTANIKQTTGTSEDVGKGEISDADGNVKCGTYFSKVLAVPLKF